MSAYAAGHYVNFIKNALSGYEFEGKSGSQGFEQVTIVFRPSYEYPRRQ